MQIGSNITGMPALLFTATDVEGRDHWVVVVKGTFAIGNEGGLQPADEQEPIRLRDEPREEPGTSSLLFEAETAPFKPRGEVLICGMAVAPNQQPVTEMEVGFQVGKMMKRLVVTGDRRWQRGGSGLEPSSPEAFTEMPLIWERAFGGIDPSSPDPDKPAYEPRNLLGIGFCQSNPAALEGQKLPNIEYADKRLQKPGDVVDPAGFGPLARNWQPRVQYAGKYNKAWRTERCPLLPEDFDEQFFQSAPEDQQGPYFSGGETVRCLNMNAASRLAFRLPKRELAVCFRFSHGDQTLTANLDTLILRPHISRVEILWRIRVPTGRKFNALREVLVGKEPEPSAAIAPEAPSPSLA